MLPNPPDSRLSIACLPSVLLLAPRLARPGIELIGGQCHFGSFGSFGSFRLIQAHSPLSPHAADYRRHYFAMRNGRLATSPSLDFA